MKIFSWNINGLRSILNKGILQDPHILCLNETRVGTDYLKENRINEIFFPKYYTFWNNSQERKGYSGVSIISRIQPKKYNYGIECDFHDKEGRVITLEFEEFFLVSVYVPNSGDELKRLDYRVNEWDEKFKHYLNKLRKKGKKVIVAGDFNVAHQNIDVHCPLGKETQAGFTTPERSSFGNLLDSGFTDIYRYIYPNRREYTFWSNRTIGARDRNKGWRIDYFLLSKDMKAEDNVKECDILGKYTGSDHAPIKIVLK